jgi:hypothetical protein
LVICSSTVSLYCCCSEQAINIKADAHRNYSKSYLECISTITNRELDAGSRYFCESLFWASQPKQAAKT